MPKRNDDLIATVIVTLAAIIALMFVAWLVLRPLPAAAQDNMTLTADTPSLEPLAAEPKVYCTFGEDGYATVFWREIEVPTQLVVIHGGDYWVPTMIEGSGFLALRASHVWIRVEALGISQGCTWKIHVPLVEVSQ